MRISGTTPATNAAATERTAETAGADSAAPATAAAASAAPELQSAVMQPAIAALRDMPDVDHAKVAALRDALARGEIRFDAGRLAGLIERFHGSRG
jgi:negative regulator of flagellin synthesis FlgM